jgi:hypothetical protein
VPADQDADGVSHSGGLAAPENAAGGDEGDDAERRADRGQPEQVAVAGGLGDMAGMGESGRGGEGKGKAGDTLHRADLQYDARGSPAATMACAAFKTAPV